MRTEARELQRDFVCFPGSFELRPFVAASHIIWTVLWRVATPALSEHFLHYGDVYAFLAGDGTSRAQTAQCTIGVVCAIHLHPSINLVVDWM